MRERRTASLGFAETVTHQVDKTKFLLYSTENCVQCCLVAKSIQLFHSPMDGSPPGSSVHGISQARILKWVAISFSRGSSQPKDQTHVSCISGKFFTNEPLGIL